MLSHPSEVKFAARQLFDWQSSHAEQYSSGEVVLLFPGWSALIFCPRLANSMLKKLVIMLFFYAHSFCTNYAPEMSYFAAKLLNNSHN